MYWTGSEKYTHCMFNRNKNISVLGVSLTVTTANYGHNLWVCPVHKCTTYILATFYYQVTFKIYGPVT